jgi:hypothetical protein
LLTACSGHGNGGSTTAPAGAAALTDAEILYGVSPSVGYAIPTPS